MIYEVFGWAAMGLNVWGNLALTNKNIWGWTIRLISNVGWIAYSAHVEAWPLLANHAVFAIINVIGWIRWDRDEKSMTGPESLGMSAGEYLKKNSPTILDAAESGDLLSREITRLVHLAHTCDGTKKDASKLEELTRQWHNLRGTCREQCNRRQ